MAAMSSTPFLRLLLLLLLPTAFFFREREHGVASASINDDEQDQQQAVQHPIVLVPGMGCSDLEARLSEAYRPSSPRCGAMKGQGWFELWKNASDLAAHDYVDCFLEQMRLVYDPAANDYRNLPGVETRVPDFGSARGFREKDPMFPKRCLDFIREALERAGYRDGDTLFGAPFDWRYAPPAPGQPSQVYSLYFRQFKSLVEAAAKKHHRKRKVIIFAHSYGGMAALEFLRHTPLSWRKEHIKHLVLAAPILYTGMVQQQLAVASGPTNMSYVGASDSSMKALWRAYETSLVALPSPAAFGHRPVVVTRQRNYSAHDTEDFLYAVGFGDGAEAFRRRMLPRMRSSFEAPMVPMTCINGVGVSTPEQLVYSEADYDKPPERVVYGDGDGCINLVSMLAFDKQMRRQSGQKQQFKSIKIDGAGHCDLIMEEWAINRVIQEILEANRPVSSSLFVDRLPTSAVSLR